MERVNLLDNKKGYNFIKYTKEEDNIIHYSSIGLDEYKTLTELDILRINKDLQLNNN